jgi:hypothetical protein
MSSHSMNRPALISVFSDQRRTKSTIWSRVSDDHPVGIFGVSEGTTSAIGILGSASTGAGVYGVATDSSRRQFRDYPPAFRLQHNATIMQRLQELLTLVTSAFVQLAVTERDQRLIALHERWDGLRQARAAFGGWRLRLGHEDWPCLPEAEDRRRRHERSSCRGVRNQHGPDRGVEFGGAPGGYRDWPGGRRT